MLNSRARNNFNQIRLIAASQVAISHILHHFQVGQEIVKIIDFIPGVPIFFFVSGFLIYGSFEHSQALNRGLIDFFRNRALRLYPGLWLCCIISLLLVWFSGYLSLHDFLRPDLYLWLFGSGTIIQFYNPDLLRDYGVGALNGSLWSVSVEIQFYILFPLVFKLISSGRFSPFVLIAIFIFLNQFFIAIRDDDSLFFKLMGVSFIPWLYMFLLGAIFNANKELFNSALKIPASITFVIYMFMWWLSDSWGNYINPLAFFALALLILKVAFSSALVWRIFPDKNDVSYGIYIYHMPVVNFILHGGFSGLIGVFLSIIFTFMLAFFSWAIVEKRALNLKRYSYSNSCK